jgi:hypothetical protein
MKVIGYRAAMLLAIGLLFVSAVAAQVEQSEHNGTREHSSEKERAAEASLRARVAETISRLNALATEAQTFEPRSRARIQTQVADLLWKFDRVFARSLFLKAWEAAEATDREAAEKQQNTNQNTSNDLRDARREVISAIWQRDPVLGQELLAKMIKGDEEAQRDNQNANSSSAAQANKLSPAELERLNVAAQLLGQGATAEAATIAGDILNRAVIPSLRFLSQLREKDATAADQLYVSLLARIAADPAADANTISILSSYVFSPYVYVTIAGHGSPRIVQNTGEAQLVDVSPRVRSQFFELAAQVLLRPTTDPTAQRTTYLIALRLLPFFERFNPSLAAQIKTTIEQMSTVVPSGLRDPELVAKLRSGISNPDLNENIQDILDRAKQLPNGSARNRLYIRAAILAAGAGDRRTAQILEEIDDNDLRDRVRGYVYMLLAKQALARKEIESVLEFARSEALSPIERVWLYLQAAGLSQPKSRSNALDLMTQAVALARRMDATDPDKARALTAVALQFMKHNRRLAEPYLIEAVTAQKPSAFDGDDGVLEVRLETPVGDWTTFYGAPNFRLKNLFRELAKEDFFEALNMSDNLKDKEVRAQAIVAIAEIALSNANAPSR